MRVRLEALGCRLNTSEVESLARRFAAAGHQVVGPDEPADVCVLNTCAVTHIAARKSRQETRRLKRAHSEAALVVTGCYAELEPDQAAALGVDMVVGNRDKERIVELVEARWGEQEKISNIKYQITNQQSHREAPLSAVSNQRSADSNPTSNLQSPTSNLQLLPQDARLSESAGWLR